MTGEVRLADGSTLRVRRDPHGITLAVVGAWKQRLTLEDAWQLAELLDELATSALEGGLDEDELLEK